MAPEPGPGIPGQRTPSFSEFVVLMAMIMALQALAIDAMLPALPAIGQSLRVSSETATQWIVVTYLAGMGLGQLFFGTVSDRFGRRPTLVVGMLLYVLCAFLSANAHSFASLLVLRTAHGFASSSATVCRSIVRDCYSGRRMARVMSLTFIVFLLVPVLAPSLGQLMLLVVSWRGVFASFGIMGLVVLLWTILRLPETLHPEYRAQITLHHLLEATRVVVREPASLYYSLAMTASSGAFVAYISTVQPLFADVFHRPELMPVMFALCAGSMGVSSYVNSRLVMRLGMRRISHAALLAYLVVCIAHVLMAMHGHEGMASFVVMQSLTMMCLGMAVSNFGAMAMEPIGAVAGIGASLQGFVSTFGGSLCGALINAFYDGTTIPLAAGGLLCGIVSLIVVLIVEQGRLFRPHTHPIDPDRIVSHH